MASSSFLYSFNEDSHLVNKEILVEEPSSSHTNLLFVEEISPSLLFTDTITIIVVPLTKKVNAGISKDKPNVPS